jgi:serralysin
MIFRKTTFSKSRSSRPNAAARRRTSTQVESLERRVVFSVNPAEDFGSANASKLSHLSPTTCGCPGCSAPSPAALAGMADSPAMPAQFPLADTFKLQSLNTASKRIYLDFDGHTTEGTQWVNGGKIVTPAYSLDDSPLFSDLELTNIQEIWARVSEDFVPFEVDVTTQEPTLDDLRKVGVADTSWGIRVVIGRNTWGSQGSGVAYRGSFNFDSDTPVFVFPEILLNMNRLIADCVSHETGHSLGLRHDALKPADPSSNTYYDGHGVGATSWSPIMGGVCGGTLALE